MADHAAIVTIKRYANRRFYNIVTQRYVSVEQIVAMANAGEAVAIRDAANDEDTTSSVLAKAFAS